MNINSTISHYQGSIIMMNALLLGVSLQDRKNKKQYLGWKYSILTGRQKKTRWKKNSPFSPDLNTKSAAEMPFMAEL